MAPAPLTTIASLAVMQLARKRPLNGIILDISVGACQHQPMRAQPVNVLGAIRVVRQHACVKTVPERADRCTVLDCPALQIPALHLAIGACKQSCAAGRERGLDSAAPANRI